MAKLKTKPSDEHFRKVAIALCKMEDWREAKRPLGNSDIDGDILALCGIEPADEDEGYSDDQTDYAYAVLDGVGRWMIKELQRAAKVPRG